MGSSRKRLRITNSALPAWKLGGFRKRITEMETDRMITSIQDQLLRDEGMRLRPYRDSVGKLTIGIGRNLDDVGISEAEAVMLLENDLGSARRGLQTALPWTAELDEVRFGALLNMCFNLGLVGLLKFTHFLASLQAGDWKMASLSMLNSMWAGQVGVRAQRLATQIETGEWQ
jgi:lysozyme